MRKVERKEYEDLLNNIIIKHITAIEKVATEYNDMYEDAIEITKICIENIKARMYDADILFNANEHLSVLKLDSIPKNEQECKEFLSRYIQFYENFTMYKYASGFDIEQHYVTVTDEDETYEMCFKPSLHTLESNADIRKMYSLDVDDIAECIIETIEYESDEVDFIY